MNYKKIILLLLIGTILLSISTVVAEDINKTDIGDNSQVEVSSTNSNLYGDTVQSDDTTAQRTFTATGDRIGYSPESYYGAKLSKKAKTQIKQFKNTNKNNKKSYSITISEKQYNQLVTAKNQGKIKEIQIKTPLKITIKNPVFKKFKKTILNKKYSTKSAYTKALKKFKNKYYINNDYIIKSYKNTKKIKIIKKCKTVKYFKTSTDKITASLVVNDLQADGKDWVYFFSPKLGIDGIMASKHIKLI